MSYIEKEQLIKADIASIENRVRHAFNQGYDLGFKDGQKRAKLLEQEPTTKKDLAVASECKLEDCMQTIVDVLGWYTDLDIPRMEDIAKDIMNALPSVYPKSDSSDYFTSVVGTLAEMYVNGEWIRGRIVKGYRFDDGIVTIETDDGKRYWCGQDRTDIYRRVVE